MFADCPLLTYGRVAGRRQRRACFTASAFPPALGVMLWIFARLSQTRALPAARARRRGEHLASRRLHRHRRHFDRRQHRFCVAGISARQFGFAVRRISAHRHFRRRHVRRAARTRTVSVALVPAGGAALVPVDLFDGKSFSRRIGRFAASRRRSLVGGSRTIWFSSGSRSSASARRFISCRNSPDARCKAIISRCSRSGL